MRISITLLIICLLGIGQSTFAQIQDKDDEPTQEETDKKFDWSKVYIGGDAFVRFGNFTNISMSPLIGYSFTKEWSAGIGGKYIYFRELYPSGTLFKTSMYGGSVFTRYLIGQSILLHGEFETINREVIEPFSNRPVRKWINIGLVGGGYRQGALGNTYLQVLVLYDLFDQPNSPYSGQYLFGSTGPPIILRGGITIGL